MLWYLDGREREEATLSSTCTATKLSTGDNLNTMLGKVGPKEPEQMTNLNKVEGRTAAIGHILLATRPMLVLVALEAKCCVRRTGCELVEVSISHANTCGALQRCLIPNRM